AVATVMLFPTDLNVTRMVWFLGILSGVLNGLGALTSFAAFSAGAKSSVAVPVMYLSPLITVLMARLFLHEQISVTQWIGIFLAPISAWLLSIESD
ncbi:MAG: EamA family transporter, partial [Acidobacteria bacterium]|nr:EamA family transporter [Acidobacteriota bacterium]